MNSEWIVAVKERAFKNGLEMGTFKLEIMSE